MTAPTAFGFVGYALLQLFVLSLIVLSLCDLCRRVLKRDDLATFCAAIFALGLLGYLAFWLAWASYAVFSVAKIVLLSALIANVGLILFQRRIGEYRWLAEPLLYASLFTFAVLMVGLSNGGFAHPPNAIAARFGFWLPADNEVPWIVAEALKRGRVLQPLFADWLMSDRPPLQAGLYLLLVLQRGWVGYHIIATWTQATFLFGVWAVLVAAAVPASARRLITLACCLLPTVVVNTLYTWPKMLSVCCLLFGFALAFLRRDDDDRALTGVLIGGFAALAMLSHGSAAFALIGFAVVTVLFWAWPPLRTTLAAAGTFLALNIPWSLFQSLVDPPGNRLVKWHLAGVVPIDSRGFLTTLRDSYGALSWNEYWSNKRANLDPLIGTWPGGLRDLFSSHLFEPAAAVQLRTMDFFALLPSLHGFSLALFIAALLLPFIGSPARRTALLCLAAAIATLAVFVLLIFVPGQTVNHQGTYAVQVLLALFALVVLATRAPWLAWAFIALQLVTVVALYGVTLRHDPALWPMLAIAGAAVTGLVAYSALPHVRRAG